MRAFVAATLAAFLALPVAGGEAAAVTGFDSAYAGESAFIQLLPGQTGEFTVFFQNRGPLTWTRGTATQVDLAACLANKTTCNAQDATEAAFNDGSWLSPVRYATHTQTSVAPGAIGTFRYAVRAPAGALAATYRFNGDLVRSSTGERIHPEGYFQDATVPAVGGVGTTTLSLTPADDTNRTRTTHTVTAQLTTSFGQPVAGALIRFNVSRVTPDGQSLGIVLSTTRRTGSGGTVSLTYRGPGFRATDAISACADLDEDGSCPEPGESADGAVKRWVR
jgi:hypothetical protein